MEQSYVSSKTRYPVSVAPAPAPKVKKKVAKKEVKDVKKNGKYITGRVLLNH